MPPAPPSLIVAGLSVRGLAEAAAREGWRVLALDLFGDADTRAASSSWRSLARADAPLRLDGAALAAALRDWRGVPGLHGWIPGPGLEAEPEVLAAAAAVLPPLGMTPAAIARLRDPVAWTATLQAHHLSHPETRPDACARAPADRRGWLLKSSQGSGGWQVRRALRGNQPRCPRPGDFWQREAPGRPASLLYVADGRQATVVAAQWQRSRPRAGRPWTFHGLIGPVQLPGRTRARAEAALQALVPAFGLIGLGSLDLLVQDETPILLEINPRPSASLTLYPELPLIAAHLAACGRAAGRDLPCPLAAADPAQTLSPTGLRGSSLVEAPDDLTLDAATAAALARQPGVHDQPAAGSRFRRGDPVCSLRLQAADEATLEAVLARERARLRALLRAAARPGIEPHRAPAAHAPRPDDPPRPAALRALSPPV